MNKSALYLCCLTFLLLSFSSLTQAGVNEVIADDVISTHQNSLLPQEQGNLLPPLTQTKMNVEDPIGEGMTFIPKITTGMMYLGYEEKTKSRGTQVKRSDNLPFVGVGGIIHWRRWAVGVYAQKSDKGHDSWYEKEIIKLENSVITADTYLDSEFRLTDYSVNVDYEIFNHFSVSAGYKITELETSITDPSFIKSEIIKPATTTDTVYIESQDISLTVRVPSFGVSYDWLLNEDMSLGANLAYGKSSVKRNATDISHGTDRGIALGINFSHRLPRHHFRYVISAEYYQYNMIMDEMVTVTTVTGEVRTIALDNIEIKERLATLKATLIWEF